MKQLGKQTNFRNVSQNRYTCTQHWTLADILCFNQCFLKDTSVGMIALALVEELLDIFDKADDMEMSNYKIIRGFLSQKDVNDFLELALPLYQFVHTKQGIVEKNKKQGDIENDNQFSMNTSPVKWINIRGIEEYTVYCEILHLFLLCRGIYDQCKQYGTAFVSETVENGKKYRAPYTFTNLYEKDKYHGVGLHKNDIDLFSMVIMLTDDYGDGVLQIKDQHGKMCKIEMGKGDAVILAKDVYHTVPVMKRDHDRIILGLHY